MQRDLSVAPQLLLTHQPNTSSTSIDLSISSPSSSPSGAGVHTSATSLQQLPHPQEVLAERQSSIAPTSTTPGNSASHPTAATASATTHATPTNTAATPSTGPPGSAVAFNYLLAASWHPKSRNPKQASTSLSARSSSSGSEGSDNDNDGDEEEENKTKWWKQKLRAGKVDAGEDAFFHVSTPSRVALGVADGVGGWSEVSLAKQHKVNLYLLSVSASPFFYADMRAYNNSGVPPAVSLSVLCGEEAKSMDGTNPLVFNPCGCTSIIVQRKTGDKRRLSIDLFTKAYNEERKGGARALLFPGE